MHRRSQGGGPGPPPIKTPLTTKSYDNIAPTMFSCILFSVIAHITVIKQQSNSKANGFGRKIILNFGEDLFFFFFFFFFLEITCFSASQFR